MSEHRRLVIEQPCRLRLRSLRVLCTISKTLISTRFLRLPKFARSSKPSLASLNSMGGEYK